MQSREVIINHNAGSTEPFKNVNGEPYEVVYDEPEEWISDQQKARHLLVDVLGAIKSMQSPEANEAFRRELAQMLIENKI